MIARRPLGNLHAVSIFLIRRHVSSSLTIPTATFLQHRSVRQYAQNKPVAKHFDKTPSTSDPVKSALTIVESQANADRVNPPASTRPPPLNLPTRADESIFIYYFRLGRAYGTFYKDGIKAVWFNNKAARLLKQRITTDLEAKDVTDAVAKNVISRAEFQLLARNSRDISKLPLFGLLVLIFGEWLVLIVPFVPNRVPGTCQIPKQVQGMRAKAEERRHISFRQGISEPSRDQMPEDELDNLGASRDITNAWPMAFSAEYRRSILQNLRDDQLHHLSCTLGLHNRLWDRIQLAPPSFLLRRMIDQRLQYLSQDDLLLLQNGGAHKLAPDELHIACEERGMDILGHPDAKLRENLAWWLKRQQEDAGWGRSLCAMLFRRTNAWKDVPGGGKRGRG